MDSLQLRVQKRAFPSHGRARLHSEALIQLGIAEEEDLEVTPARGGPTIVVTAFADGMVDSEAIRISADDMKELGVDEGDLVVVTKKPPIHEQVKRAAKETADQISRAAGDVEDSLRDVAAQAKTGTSQAAETVREQALRMKDTVTGAAAGAALKIEDYNLKGRINSAVESAMKKLQPDESKKLISLLEKNNGAIRAATVATTAAVDHRIPEITIPVGVVLVAVQRNDTILMPTADTLLVRGDVVYLAGSEAALGDAIRNLEG